MTGSGAAARRDPELAHVLSLLERALAYTGGVLGMLPRACDGIPTPCRDWDLERLLEHMEDALDAFGEAAAGTVRMDPARLVGVADRPERLRAKACSLLGAWARGAPSDVQVGDLTLAAEVLVPAAALEISVHGWDVARAIGGPGLDPALARDLAPAAALLVPPGPARAGRFDPPPTDLAGPEDGLLRWLGRAQATGNETTNRAPSPATPA